MASPVFDSFLVVESLENVVYVEGDCPIEVCVGISERVSKEDVLFENFFRDKQSITNNLRAHKKFVLRTISVNGFEDESYRVVQHSVLGHDGSVVGLLDESKLKMGRKFILKS